MTLYDTIGDGYAKRRMEDPRIMKRIERALGDASSVVNVGAGTGSYESKGRSVISVEPSEVMAAQRPFSRPVVRGVASALPLHDKSVDAATTILSMHHWPDPKKGVAEMCRVARDPVVIVTIDAEVSGAMWLMADYLPEVRDLDLDIFPAVHDIEQWLMAVGAKRTRVEPLLTHRDSEDHNLLSFWAHPQRVLDAQARAVTSGFARQPPAVVERVVSAVSKDLASGAWEQRHGALRKQDEYDAGLRLVHASL